MIAGNWGYVAFGYLVSAAVLGAYCARLAIGLRRARATHLRLGEDGGERQSTAP